MNSENTPQIQQPAEPVPVIPAEEFQPMLQEAQNMEQSESSVKTNFQSRVRNLAENLIDENTGKVGILSRFKRRTGEEVLSLYDESFRNNFARYMGASVLTTTGLAAVEYVDNTPGQIAGAVLASAALASVPKLSRNMRENFYPNQQEVS